MKDSTTRQRIVAAANELFYEQGFEETSFTCIAEVVGITRGNFYHHFKSKDEILEAVIASRLTSTKEMLACWELEGADPEGRILRFIEILARNRTKIQKFGCPVGTLCTELAKLNHASRGQANEIFSLFRTWLREQFELMGRESEADALAMHLLARSQGVAVLAQTFHEDEFIRTEVITMRNWLRGVSTCLS